MTTHQLGQWTSQGTKRWPTSSTSKSDLTMVPQAPIVKASHQCRSRKVRRVLVPTQSSTRWPYCSNTTFSRAREAGSHHIRMAIIPQNSPWTINLEIPVTIRWQIQLKVRRSAWLLRAILVSWNKQWRLYRRAHSSYISPPQRKLGAIWWIQMSPIISKKSIIRGASSQDLSSPAIILSQAKALSIIEKIETTTVSHLHIQASNLASRVTQC